MKWEKLGQIFEFEKSPIKDRYLSHAQSPQALVLEDSVRIFFSTRKKDDTEKFLSHIQYVDYDKDLQKIIGYSDQEVITLGNLGCFDEHGIFPISPMTFQDKIYAYTTGWTRRVSVDVDTGIGLAISTDQGQTFQKMGDGPVLSASLHEPFLVGDAFVRIIGGTFHMFYIYGTKWSQADESHAPERVYKIGHAVSTDGISWQKTGKQLITDIIDENECQALPTVIEINGRFHMYFCYRHMDGFRSEKGKGYKLGYAYSDDLISWTRDDQGAGIELSAEGWDSEMMCYPNIFECNDNVYLLYNGNNFGRDGFGIAKLTSK